MPLAFLVATSEARISVPQNVATSRADAPAQFQTTLTATLQNYYKLIRDNHGIKETNVLRLFTPLGAPATAFGSTLLPDLDSFGALRGEHAHLSARAIQTVPDAETECRRVRALVNALTVLDDWLVKCRASIR